MSSQVPHHNHSYSDGHSETTPLVSKKGSLKRDETTALHEAKVMFAYAFPLTLTSLMRYLAMTSGIVAVSRLGTVHLAASSLALLTANVFGFAFTFGLVSALDTLANQASTSASPKMTSIYAMRTFVVCCLFMPFQFLCCFNGRTIFSLVLPNADDQMVTLAADYLKVVSLALLPVAGFECVRRYLAAFGILRGPTIAFCIVTPFSLLSNYLLILGPYKSLRIGFMGAPITIVLSYTILFIVLLVYAAFVAPRHTLAPLSSAIFQDLGLPLKYGLAGIASTCSEWFAFEGLSLAAGYMGVQAQATNAIFATICSLLYQLPVSMSMAASVRVGNLLGSNLPRKAKKASAMAQIFALAEVLLCSSLFIGYKERVATIFSNDPVVIKTVKESIYVLALVHIFDGLQGANSGILKGLGLPTVAAQVNLVAYWIIGAPITAVLALKYKSVASLWGGLAIGLFLASSLMALKIYSNDFEERAREAASRIATSESHIHILLSEEEGEVDGDP